MGSMVSEAALAALEREFTRAERSLACLRAAIHDVCDAARTPPPRVLAPPPPSRPAETLLFVRPVQPQRTVRDLICEALRHNDRPGGLGPLALSAIIHIDKQHINVELCHMVKQGRVRRVAYGLYRVMEAVEQEAQQA